MSRVSVVSLVILLQVFASPVFAKDDEFFIPASAELYVESRPSPLKENWLWITGGAALVAGLSQIEDSHITFAALEAGTAFFMLNEWYKDDKAPMTKLITPLGLTTLALVNLTLLRDDDTTRGDVFRYNAGGLSLLTLNYFWTY